MGFLRIARGGLQDGEEGVSLHVRLPCNRSGAPDTSIWWLSIIMKGGSPRYGWDFPCKAQEKSKKRREARDPGNHSMLGVGGGKRCGKARMECCSICKSSDLLKKPYSSLHLCPPWFDWKSLSHDCFEEKNGEEEGMRVWSWKSRQGLQTWESLAGPLAGLELGQGKVGSHLRCKT